MSIDSFDFATGKKIDARKRRVILSDIDMEDLSAIQKVLRELRFTILGKEQSLRALLELVRKHKIGVLMLDIDNPEVNIDEHLPAIQEKFPEMLVILMSAKADKAIFQKSITMGAAGFLVRPINPDSLKKVLSTIE